MRRYIDLDKYIAKLNTPEIVEKMKDEKFLYEQGYLSGVIQASITAKKFPIADVVEVRHGEWKKVHEKAPRYVCTSCNHLYNNKEYKYCPECGAKMDGERKEG